MPSIGVKYWGIYSRVPDNHEAILGQIYESRGSLNQPIPEDIALGFLKDWRERLTVEKGIITNYIEVKGTDFVVQWKVTGTPEPGTISTIITIIVAIAAIVAATYFLSELKATIHETGQVLSIMGPENLSMLMNILFLFAMLMMFGPLISVIAEIPSRIMPRRE
ncbi:MAG: hypothetical protein QXO00_02455 [Candidatus Bathyarchaeia archaeon]